MLVAEKENFEQEVLSSEKPVLVYFWGTTCPACKLMSPQMDKLAAENDERYRIVKVNINENPEIAERYQVMSTPTLALFHPGKEPTAIQIGFAAKPWVAELLNKYL